jgi:hypothetical protein
MPQTFTDVLHELTDEKVSLSSIFRKVTVLSYDIKFDKLKQWVEQEQNGYLNSDDVPDYRIVRPAAIRGQFMGFAGAQINNGVISINHLPQLWQDAARSWKVRTDIAGLEEIVTSNKDKSELITVELPLEVAAKLQVYQGYTCTYATLGFTPAQFSSIISAVRNRLLTFLLEMRDAFPDIVNPQIEPIATAQASSIFHTAIYGSVQGSQIVVGGGSIDQSPLTFNRTDSVEWPPITDFVTQLRDIIESSSLDETPKKIATSDLSTIETQLQSPQPKPSIIVESLKSVRTVLEGSIGNLMANVVQPLLPTFAHWLHHFGSMIQQ